MNDLTIIDVTIRQDDAGRYCLNDLHLAAGGAERHRPSRFTRYESCRALVEILRPKKASEPFGILTPEKASEPLVKISTGAPATYVVKELVYAYAMWISPAFHLKVIRAYDALVTGEIASHAKKASITERAYFKRYPKRSLIRLLALKGEPYWYIARAAQCSAATVGNAIRHMIEWGLMDAGLLRACRTGMQAWWAHRRNSLNQLELRF